MLTIRGSVAPRYSSNPLNVRFFAGLGSDPIWLVSRLTVNVIGGAGGGNGFVANENSRLSFPLPSISPNPSRQRPARASTWAGSYWSIG